MQKRQNYNGNFLATHCLDLMLENLAKKTVVHGETILKVLKLLSFIDSKTSLIPISHLFTKYRDFVKQCKLEMRDMAQIKVVIFYPLELSLREPESSSQIFLASNQDIVLQQVSNTNFPFLHQHLTSNIVVCWIACHDLNNILFFNLFNNYIYHLKEFLGCFRYVRCVNRPKIQYTLDYSSKSSILSLSSYKSINLSLWCGQLTSIPF